MGRKVLLSLLNAFSCSLNKSSNPLLSKLSKRQFYDTGLEYDTIFAPASYIDPIKGSPLAIVRVSGHRAGQILNQLTGFAVESAGKARKQHNIKPRQATLARFVSPKNNDLIDIGLVIWFPNPSSYTGEDVCEFHLHGSQSIMTTMLSTIGELPGTRLAEPGEFSQRAFKNRKLTLIQAESLSDLIASKTDFQRRLALRGLSRATKTHYEQWIEELVGILAHLEASIDFGEDELIGEREVVDDCIMRLARLSEKVEDYIKMGAQLREIARVGARVVILGKPNAGKSTFMNLLCKQDKSIVSDLSGTTRDIVEHTISIGGHTVILNDTAGLRPCNNSYTTSNITYEDDGLRQHSAIEKEGINRAIKAAQNANLVIYLIDAVNLSHRTHEEVVNQVIREIDEMLNLVRSDLKKTLHIVINKLDLDESLSQINFEEVLGSLPEFLKSYDVHITSLSCKTHKNLDRFVNHLKRSIDKMADDSIRLTDDGAITTLSYVNERHLSLLTSVLSHLATSKELNIDKIDEMAQHVRESIGYMSRIVGSVSNERVFDVIFEDFCIGK